MMDDCRTLVGVGIPVVVASLELFSIGLGRGGLRIELRGHLDTVTFGLWLVDCDIKFSDFNIKALNFPQAVGSNPTVLFSFWHQCIFRAWYLCAWEPHPR